MGELIVLTEQLADRARPRAEARPAFFFDLACPFSYLAAERVERLLGEVEWVPVAGPLSAENAGAHPCAAAEIRAAQLRLPLVWPESFPAPIRAALRAAVRATQLGCGARFVIAAARLAFCGGFDLDDPEVLAEAAAASGFQLEKCLAAAGDEALDGSLDATARGLIARGVDRLPAVRVRHGFFAGESLLTQAAAVSRSAASSESCAFPWG
jgi:2-hydroxychromene-2-carboxylate isomerase